MLLNYDNSVKSTSCQLSSVEAHICTSKRGQRAAAGRKTHVDGLTTAGAVEGASDLSQPSSVSLCGRNSASGVVARRAYVDRVYAGIAGLLCDLIHAVTAVKLNRKRVSVGRTSTVLEWDEALEAVAHVWICGELQSSDVAQAAVGCGHVAS